MNSFDDMDGVLRALKNVLWGMSAFAMLLAFGWLFMFGNFAGFARCMLLSLICALTAQSDKY